LRNPGTDFKLIIIQIHGLRQINSDYGWDFGNEALKFFAKATQQSFPDHCKFFRLNPALFAVWSPSELINPRLEDSLHFLNHEVESSPYPQLKFSIGTASTLQFNNTSDLVTAAQKKLIKYVRPSF
jgi:FOG: GGDEF domain